MNDTESETEKLARRSEMFMVALIRQQGPGQDLPAVAVNMAWLLEKLLGEYRE